MVSRAWANVFLGGWTGVAAFFCVRALAGVGPRAGGRMAAEEPMPSSEPLCAPGIGSRIASRRLANSSGESDASRRWIRAIAAVYISPSCGHMMAVNPVTMCSQYGHLYPRGGVVPHDTRLAVCASISRWHRWTAHKKAGAETIRVSVTETKSEAEFLELAIERKRQVRPTTFSSRQARYGASHLPRHTGTRT